jgi:hypothetical protein
MTPRWSRKAVWTVTVSTVWREIRLGSHMVRWSMQDSWPGCWRGVKVKLCGPRPRFVWEASNVCIFRGRLPRSPLEVPSQDDEGMWEGVR